jgi:hypothetical protein
MLFCAKRPSVRVAVASSSSTPHRDSFISASSAPNCTILIWFKGSYGAVTLQGVDVSGARA